MRRNGMRGVAAAASVGEVLAEGGVEDRARLAGTAVTSRGGCAHDASVSPRPSQPGHARERAERDEGDGRDRLPGDVVERELAR